ncbi:MAG: type 4a pilus biogenesis protein PilO [Planctomycetota bacterium]
MRTGLRELLLLVVLLGVPVASFFLVFRPQNAEIKAAKAEIEIKRAVLVKLREETARSADLEKSNKQILGKIQAIEARLPSKKEVENVVRQVSDLAVAAGLGPPSMKSAKAIKTATYMEQPLELATDGSFTGFYDFVVKLEQLARITKMTDLKLKRKLDDDGRMEATFTLSIYHQDEPGATQ